MEKHRRAQHRDRSNLFIPTSCGARDGARWTKRRNQDQSPQWAHAAQRVSPVRHFRLPCGVCGFHLHGAPRRDCKSAARTREGLMPELDLLRALPRVKRNIQKRKEAKDPSVVDISKQYGEMYFD